MSSWISIGYISHAHNLKGEVFVKTDVGAWAKSVKQMEFKSPNGETRRWTVESIRKHKDGAIVKVAGINDRSAAEAQKSTEVFIEPSFLVAPKGQVPYLREFLNMNVVDAANDQPMGTIKSFQLGGMQDLAVIVNDQGSFEFPLVKELIDNVDYENNIIRIHNVPGLQDLNS